MQDDNTGPCHERVFANSYVDLGKVDTVGFDYDYTLVTYTEELLELIYDMALKTIGARSTISTGNVEEWIEI